VLSRKQNWEREQPKLNVWKASTLAARFLAHIRGTDLSAHIQKRRAEGSAENTI
jgi:hypothetical protein